MNITMRNAGKSDFSKVRALYMSAFPPEERPPFRILRRKYKQGKGKLLVVDYNNEFAGFAYLVCHLDMAYLFFLAVKNEYRNRGCGSQVLQMLLKEYDGKRLFLAREQLEEAAENYDERVRRHNFYLRNGFTDLPCKLKEGNMIYDVMSNGTPLSAADYDSLISEYSGKLMRRFVDMRLLESR